MFTRLASFARGLRAIVTGMVPSRFAFPGVFPTEAEVRALPGAAFQDLAVG